MRNSIGCAATSRKFANHWMARSLRVGSDFLMQELNREANTLSSKSQDAETTRAAVDMKVIIEQMREQVQNVEIGAANRQAPIRPFTIKRRIGRFAAEQ